MVHYLATATPEITFATFTQLLESIASTKPRKANQRKGTSKDSLDKPATLFQEWANRLGWPPAKNTGKIIFRLLFPDQDIRRKYNLQEARLAKYFIKIFDLNTGPGQRGEGLLRWNTTGEDRNGVTLGKDGCLGLELQNILQQMHYEPPQGLNLSDVDRLLDELAASSQWSNLGVTTFQKPARHQTLVLKDIFGQLTARESAYMTQIILKDLRPLLYPLPSLSSYVSLMDYNNAAFHELNPYSIMKAWHWAMPRIFRAQADFDKASELCEHISNDHQQSLPSTRLQTLSKPQLGIPVNIPKAVKASGSCLAAPLSKLTGLVWAEIKMDGERMQIHVDTTKPESQQIKIFSKSHRDSTKERASTLVIIRAALGLPSISGSKFIESHPRPKTLTPIKSGIFEAEMVAWNKFAGKVDEFWRIAELKLKPWQAPTCHGDDIETMEQSTLGISETELDRMNTQQLDDLQSRHLALVFFDVLYLDDESHLEHSYQERRKILENCIHVIPHYSMLVERKLFDLNQESARAALRNHYATVIAERHEGLMLKTAVSIYNDYRSEHRWLKVKKDYIDGFGDTADYAIIGAAWDRDRGRELRVSTSTYTIWYVGLCDNVAEVKRNPSIRPHFQLVFYSMSYGLTRPQLEKANRMASECDGQPPSSKEMRRWPFQYDLAQGLKEPTIIFRKPLVFEMMGSGFTKRSRVHEYELRWPRITKLHDPEERDWTSTIDLQTHNSIARRATNSDPLKITDEIWGRSQGNPQTGFQAELEYWNNKLTSSDMNWLGKHRNSRAGHGPPTLASEVRIPHRNVQSSTSCAPLKLEIVDSPKSHGLKIQQPIPAQACPLKGSSERNLRSKVKSNHDVVCMSSASNDIRMLGKPALDPNHQNLKSSDRHVHFAEPLSKEKPAEREFGSPAKSSPRRIESTESPPKVKVIESASRSPAKSSARHAYSAETPSKRKIRRSASNSPTKSPARRVVFIETPIESESPSGMKSPAQPVYSTGSPLKRKRPNSPSTSEAKLSVNSINPAGSISKQKKVDSTITSSIQARNESRRARLVTFVDVNETGQVRPEATLLTPERPTNKRQKVATNSPSSNTVTCEKMVSHHATFQDDKSISAHTRIHQTMTPRLTTLPHSKIADGTLPLATSLSEESSSIKRTTGSIIVNQSPLDNCDLVQGSQLFLASTTPGHSRFTKSTVPSRAELVGEKCLIYKSHRQFTPERTESAAHTPLQNTTCIPSVRTGEALAGTSAITTIIESPHVEDTDVTCSAPPWRAAKDVRWCLVEDETNHGISGTKYNSVAQLLQSLKVPPEEFKSNSESSPVSYIFIENPTKSNLQRIQKQIVFRALSNPNIAIVGYNSKVLDIQQGCLKTWKQFELFRFNSYANEYQLLQAWKAKENNNQ